VLAADRRAAPPLQPPADMALDFARRRATVTGGAVPEALQRPGASKAKKTLLTLREKTTQRERDLMQRAVRDERLERIMDGRAEDLKRHVEVRLQERFADQVGGNSDDEPGNGLDGANGVAMTVLVTAAAVDGAAAL